MMLKRLAVIGGLALGLVAGAAHAVPGNYEIIQSQTFTQSFNGFSSNDGAGVSGSWALGAVPTVTINPFGSYDTGSGVLNQATIRWDHTISFSGRTGKYGGGAGASGGGSSLINSFNYGGGGNGGGGGGGPDIEFEFSASWSGTSPADFTFSVLGTGYGPQIWNVLVGQNLLTLSQPEYEGDSQTYDRIVSGVYTFESTVKVTYNYTGEPVKVPLPGTLALLGLGLVGIGSARRKS
jgi:hypothetical protein